MKERAINRQRAVVAHHQSAEVAEPGDGAFHRPPPLIAPQRPAVLSRGLSTIPAIRNNQLDAPPGQMIPKRVTVGATTSIKASRIILSGARPIPPTSTDGG